MRLFRGPAALFALFVLPALAAAGPIQVNAQLASQMVVPDPPPGLLTVPTVQPGDLVLNPGGEVLLGTIQFDTQPRALKADGYTATSPFSVFVRLTDTASRQTTTLRVDGDAVDEWTLRRSDGTWTNSFHALVFGDHGANTPFAIPAPLGGNDYTLRVNPRNGGTMADLILSVGPASGVPEPATLVLAGLALVPVGLRALRRKQR
jgi:hypothetical protein